MTGDTLNHHQQSLKLSLVDAFLYSLMVGLGETYLPAYVLSVGLGEIYAGLLASLPMLSGALLQLFAPNGIRALRSTKNWIVISSFLQACTYLPLVYLTMTEAPQFWLLFFILTMYWGAGFAAGPAWNYWMGHLVPAEVSSQFFSKRTRVLQIGLLIGLILGGIALHNKMQITPMTSVFSGLFFLAFLCRLLSTLALGRHHFHQSWEISETQKNSWTSLVASWKLFWSKSPQNKFFIYLFFYQTAVFISSPFVSPFFLVHMKLDYGQYMKALASLFVGKIVALWFIENKKNKISGFDLLKLGLLTVSPLPALWALSTNYYLTLLLQFSSGMAWACLEVGLLLVFFKDLKSDEKIPFLTFYNLLNSMGIIFGTGLGAIFLKLGPSEIQTYFILFILGSTLRCLAAWPLIRSLKKWQLISVRS